MLTVAEQVAEYKLVRLAMLDAYKRGRDEESRVLCARVNALRFSFGFVRKPVQRPVAELEAKLRQTEVWRDTSAPSVSLSEYARALRRIISGQPVTPT